MKKIGWIAALIFLLAACGSEENVEKNVVEQEQETVVEQEAEDKPVAEVEETATTTKSTPLTAEEFKQKYQFDDEMDQYPKGKFEFKDGTTIEADKLYFLGGETFDYASGTFVDGQIAHLQLELKEGATEEQVLAELGFNKEDIMYTPGNGNIQIVDIVIDERFADGNISRLPNEWD